MDVTTIKPKTNPLMSHMRQPKIYIKLPSQGKYWANGSLNVSVTGEYPVYSMTAKDELILKTPDALLNGQGVVSVIQSCMPNIVDAWACPHIEIDVILIAIRIATYGHNMPLTVSHELIEGGSSEFTFDMRLMLDQLQETIKWDERIEVRPNLVLYVKPFSYSIVNKNNINEFETQRIINIVKDENMDENEKIIAFQKSFQKLTELTVDLINASVYRIDSDTGSTQEPEFIQEFMQNTDIEVFDAVKERLDSLKENNKVKPFTVNVSQDPANPVEVEVPIVFDYSSFFA